MTYIARAYPSLCTMKELEVIFLLFPGQDARATRRYHLPPAAFPSYPLNHQGEERPGFMS